MLYELIFKGYYENSLEFEERRFFDRLDDLHDYSAWLIKYLGTMDLCNHYDIRVKLSDVDCMPNVA